MAARVPSEENAPVAVISDRAGLGDGLMLFPLLWDVRRRYPGRPLWWFLSCRTDLLRCLETLGHGLLDRMVELPRARWWPAEVARSLHRLPRFHRVFDARSRFGDVLLTRALVRTGRSITGFPILPWDARPPAGPVRPKAIADRIWALAEADAGRQANWQQARAAAGGFSISPRARARAREIIPDPQGNCVGVVLYNQRSHKSWPLERYEELLPALLSRGLKPVVFSGPWEAEDLARLRARFAELILCPNRYPEDRDDTFRIELTAACIERLAVGISPDTGPGHLMGLSGIPLVSLVGNETSLRFRPFADRQIVLGDLTAQPGSVLARITAAEVVEAVERMLAA